MRPLVLHKKNGESKVIEQSDFREKEECDVMKKEVAFTIDEKLYTDFAQKRSSLGETEEKAVDKALRLYLKYADKEKKAKNVQRNEITLEMVNVCYEKAKYIRLHYNDFANVKRKQLAANAVHSKTGMNADSAMMYIQAFFLMLDGKSIGMAMSKNAILYYFEHIHLDFGDDGLMAALRAVRLYLDDSVQGHPGLERLCNEFQKKVKDSEKAKVILHKKNSN